MQESLTGTTITSYILNDYEDFKSYEPPVRDATNKCHGLVKILNRPSKRHQKAKKQLSKKTFYRHR